MLLCLPHLVPVTMARPMAVSVSWASTGLVSQHSFSPSFKNCFPGELLLYHSVWAWGISAFLANGVAVGGLSRGPDETSHSAACPGWVQRLGLRSDQSPSLKYSVFPPWVMNCKPPVPRASGGHVLRVWENEALKQSAEISPSAFLSTSANFKF